MKFVKAAVIGAILIAGAAFAEGDRTDPNAKARSDLMRVVGKNTGILGDMAGGKAAYDAAAAEAAKAAIVEAAGMIEATFKDQGAADPASEAKPEIWANWDEFLGDAKKLGERIERNLGNKTSALEIIGEATVEPERGRAGAAPTNSSPDDPGGLERPATGASKDQADPLNLAGLYEALGIAQPADARAPSETKTAAVAEPATPRTQDGPEKIKELDR